MLSIETPTAHEARDLKDLALQLRLSASETEDQDYIGLFLCAAIALETRAAILALGPPYPSH